MDETFSCKCSRHRPSESVSNRQNQLPGMWVAEFLATSFFNLWYTAVHILWTIEKLSLPSPGKLQTGEQKIFYGCFKLLHSGMLFSAAIDNWNMYLKLLNEDRMRSFNYSLYMCWAATMEVISELSLKIACSPCV